MRKYLQILTSLQTRTLQVGLKDLVQVPLDRACMLRFTWQRQVLTAQNFTHTQAN